MVTSIPDIANIAVPIIGGCIIFSLLVAAYLEPKKDYSRKIYIFMLFSCAVILINEGFQWHFGVDTGANSNLLLWITMFVFYVMLAMICYCWTIYAYYWFNGFPPSKKANCAFLTGPVIEVAILIINFATGIVYFVDNSGNYVRGSFFIYYIGFSYLFLLVSILITASLAAVNSTSKQKQNIIMFLFCFLFPVLGPIAQYMFPSLSLMGTTEAIALLIVYVSIQQRTTSQYAAEMARYHIEYDQYEDSLEQLLSASSNALCVFRIDLTKNTHSGERGISEKIMAACKSDSINDLTAAFASEIRDPEEALQFRTLFDRNNLIKRFTEQDTQLSLNYHRRVDNGETHLIKVFLNMLKNPSSNDIEAIVYSEDIDRQQKEEKVISAIANREYEHIALINVESRKFNYQYSSQKHDYYNFIEMTEYDDVMSKVINNIHDPNAPGMEYYKISFQTVLNALAVQNEYSYIFDYSEAPNKQSRKEVTYQYLDDTKSDILFLGSDITEETRLERERSSTLQKALMKAQHADAMKTDFLSNLSHDMRTPLNAILGYTNLARSTFDADATKSYLDKIDKAGNVMLDLINDTLDLSKIESGEIMLKPVPTRYDYIIKKVVSMIAPQADAKHINFTVDGSAAANVPINVDALRFQEILVNLLSNAVKFTPEYGQVKLEIKCLEMDDEIVHDKIVISDTGCGMRAEFIPKMFEPFSQERQNADTPGSGLGLSIVKRLVGIMEGKIEVDSKPGKGTTFTISLDFIRADALPDDSDTIINTWDDLKDRIILLVEDNAMNTEIAKALLESKGMKVTVAENGKIACDIFSSSNPGDIDAILMDIRMPIMNGNVAAKTIRAMNRPDAQTVPIIAMSADTFDDDIQASLNAGMNGHIAKPIDTERLYEELSNVIK